MEATQALGMAELAERIAASADNRSDIPRIIRYALELGLLWIDGDGRDKVREALDALDTLEAQLEAIGAGGVQALSAAPAEADMFWDAEDGERFGHDIDDIIFDFGPGDRVKIDCAKRMPSIEVLVIEDGDDFTYQVISPTPPAEQQAAQVIINFPQVGTAGPFPVVDGRVSLPDSTMQDLVRMLRPTYEAEQQAQPGAVYAELPDSVAWLAEYGGDVFTAAQLLNFADRTHTLRKQAAPKAAPGVGNSGFDHQTAADILSGKTVSDEAVRKFVKASRWAHDERAALSATLLAMHGVLTSREAEIALLKKALLEAEAAPQQEAQEPAMIYHGRCTIDCGEGGHHDMEMLRMIPAGSKLYTAPQPAPAPLSEMPYEKRKAIQEGEQIGASDAWFHARHEMLDTVDRRNVFRAGFDRGWSAALAAQGGKA